MLKSSYKGNIDIKMILFKTSSENKDEGNSPGLFPQSITYQQLPTRTAAIWKLGDASQLCCIYSKNKKNRG